ncbi:MAG: molybdopterin-guanine dinucleotide biosynthesis protein B [Pseudomonadota bacterium]
MNNPKCFGIAGWKNSGKTSLVSALVTEISSRGLIVSTIKHAHHAFDLDTQGTDSFKHREAGAKEVMLVSANRWALQHELRGADEPCFQDMISKMAGCDLILVEGYKREAIPKIEIIGPDNMHEHIWPNDQKIKAIACDTSLNGCDLPQFERSQISDIADFILKNLDISA